MESWLSWECSHGDRHTSCLSLGMRESSFSEMLTLTFFSLSLVLFNYFSWGYIWGSDLLTLQSGVIRCTFWSLIIKAYVVAATETRPSTCNKWSRHLGLQNETFFPSFPVLFLCLGTKYSSMNTANDLWKLVSSVNQCMGDMDDLFCSCTFRAWNMVSVFKRENESTKVWPLTRSESLSLIWSLLQACVGSCGKEMKRREQISE